MSLFSKIHKYIWPQIKKNQWVFYFILFFYSLRILIDFVVVPIFFKQLIDLFSSQVLDRSTLSPQAFKIFFIIAGLHVFIFCLARLIKFTYYRFLAKLIKDLRDFSFQKISTHSYTFFSNIFAGSLVTKSRRFVNGFESAMDVFIFNFIQLSVLILGSLIVLAHQSPTVGSIFGVWVVINIGIMLLILRKKIKLDILEAEQDSKISGRLADVFGNVSAVKFFSAANREIKSFGEYTAEGERRSIKSWFLGGKMDLIQHLLIIIVIITVNYIFIVLWLRGAISLGTIVLIDTYMTLIAGKLWESSGAMVRFMKSVTDMKEMIDLFEVTPDILDPKKPEVLKMGDGHIVFKDVSFKYAVGDTVLENFNLDIKPGERVGIVGHSGAGKSTITKIILRFNDVTSGAITIDGQDIRNVKQDDLRSVISYVPQEPILFHRPIKENINYGKPNATKKEIVEVAKKAHADEFISKLAKGYDTLVGERGVKLSGGERQRVAIARAMLKDSPILILDEATSSLDSISESYIQDAFNELMKGKTTIVIAHRLSTIQKMDRIIALDAGKIIEEGTHAELLAKDGMYADLWNHQTGGFLE
jgi:ATP-binding cassette subfamily B protein